MGILTPCCDDRTVELAALSLGPSGLDLSDKARAATTATATATTAAATQARACTRRPATAPLDTSAAVTTAGSEPAVVPRVWSVRARLVRVGSSTKQSHAALGRLRNTPTRDVPDHVTGIDRERDAPDR